MILAGWPRQQTPILKHSPPFEKNFFIIFRQNEKVGLF